MGRIRHPHENLRFTLLKLAEDEKVHIQLVLKAINDLAADPLPPQADPRLAFASEIA